MPYKEFLQWVAYYSVEGANYSQTDANIAQLVVMGSHGKIKIKDILPQRKQKKQTNEEISQNLKALSALVNKNKAGKK